MLTGRTKYLSYELCVWLIEFWLGSCQPCAKFEMYVLGRESLIYRFTVLLILFPYVYCVQKPFCANFYISFFLFCRKSVQSWMRRFWAKNAEETTYKAYDGPSCMWQSVGGSVVQLLEEDGEVWPSVGLRSLWRSIVSMTVRPAGSSWSSEK